MYDNAYEDITHHSRDLKYDDLNPNIMFAPKFQIEIFCTLQFSATHCWPACPFDEVAFLRDPHRHIFHIKAYQKVSHSDRDVEFIILKNAILRYLNNSYPTGEFGSKSCEMLAQELILEFNLSQCEVSEDNENGSLVKLI